VAGPPLEIAARRARVRRRRMATLGGGLVLIALVALVAAVAGLGGAATGLPRPHSAHPRAGLHSRRPARVRRIHEIAGSSAIRRLIKLGLPIYCAGHRGKAVAFTFDDGPGPYTHLALRKLIAAGERATFFVVGRNIDRFRGYLRRELKVATLGDHTWTHPFLPALSAPVITSELERTKMKIEADSGQKVSLFRPPYGSHDPAVDQIVRHLGLLEIIWNVDSADSLGANYAQIEHTVISGLHPGAIVLMHENHGQTIRALPSIFAALERKHLRAVSVPRLLTDDPPSDVQVRAGGLGCGTGANAGQGGG
jgi:peptidoglycan/xylan/chitin deacetylase (PgdA/CDA1 family)